MPGRAPTFQPRFTLLLFYLVGFFLLYALLFALPDLLAGARALAPGPAELSAEELARARQIAREAMRGNVPIALLAALVSVGIGGWRRVLPGLR